MNSRLLTEQEYCLWDEFVNSSPQGSIFSCTWYLKALQVDYSILAIVEGGCIKAGLVLPKNEVNLLSNPMLDKYLGIMLPNCSSSFKNTSRLYKYIEVLAEALSNFRSFDYYFHPNFKNWIPMYWNGFTQQTRYTYRIDNTVRSLDDIYNDFHGNLRNDIKNSLKEGVTINQDVEFDDLWGGISSTFLRQGGNPPFNKNQLSRFISEVRQNKAFMSFGAYSAQGFCLAACGLIFDRNSSYLLLNGFDSSAGVRGANAHLIYNTIQFCHSKFKYYDFEGSMLPGVEPFYRKFGGELTPYMRIWNDNIFNYVKVKAKIMYKKIRFGK
jgi:hypothetical protein